jgi:uncharacterized protein with HEPN domain
MLRNDAYLLDILLMAKDAVAFTKDIDLDTFLSDRKSQFAVIRCFEVMGEAAKRISEHFQAQHPGVPWSKMARMRDLLIHAYGRVNPSEVWDTVQNDLPTLISYLEKLVPPEDDL